MNRIKKTSLLVFILISSLSIGQSSSDVSMIKEHLTKITKSKVYRNHTNIEQLNKIADYIKTEFSKYSDEVSFQEYSVENKKYKNVICSFGLEHKKRIVIGAHYDVCGNQEGADDNASGVVGLIELSRLLQGKKTNYRIDLVAYTLEEPPYFRTNKMGSFIHAKSLHDANIDVYGMISLEMIGYFSDVPNSQHYPVASLSSIYGNKGDYITLVNKSNKQKFARDFCSIFKNNKTIKTTIFDNPMSLESVELSDHLNYWKLGYDALMVTDTAFLRNKNYHRNSDKMETLDFDKMAKVIDGVLLTLLKI
ncbi:M28 family peptidase [Aquimarina aggregata]|uniref:M28 family peptidase n=1 Tax=Aquimarina aggregata TaxID=1642818 RepID=UPI00249127EA|nr:M28 family peptidase [Aquimarina aggregata]